MGKLGFRFVRVENGEVKSVYDDELMRSIGIKVFEQGYGLKFRSGTEYGIDLVLIDNPIIGAEGEDGSWLGDRWTDWFKSQRDIFNLGVNTLNIQNRKWHYWNLQELSDKEGSRRDWGKFDKGWNENFYFRLNAHGDQMCVVKAKSILSDSERKFALDRQVSNNTKPEDWICIPQEFVDTFNLQPSGEWVLNGEYHGPNKDECIFIHNEMKKLKTEEEKKRAVAAYYSTKKNKG